MSDPNDAEDYAQFRKFLVFRGRTPYRAACIVDKVRNSFRRKARKFAKFAKDIPREQSTTRSVLSCILFPESKLKYIPAYHRYVAYLMTKNNFVASRVLGIGRMTLWRWVQKNGYQIKQIHVPKAKAKRKARR